MTSGCKHEEREGEDRKRGGEESLFLIFYSLFSFRSIKFLLCFHWMNKSIFL